MKLKYYRGKLTKEKRDIMEVMSNKIFSPANDQHMYTVVLLIYAPHQRPPHSYRTSSVNNNALLVTPHKRPTWAPETCDLIENDLMITGYSCAAYQSDLVMTSIDIIAQFSLLAYHVYMVRIVIPQEWPHKTGMDTSFSDRVVHWATTVLSLVAQV